MDQIGNFLTSIRNAELAGHSALKVPYSKLHIRLLEILKRNGYVASFTEEKADAGQKPILKVALPVPVVRHHYKRISTPGRRLYVGADKIPMVRRGLGIVVLSTPMGVMTGKEANHKGIGGELMFEAY